MSLQLHSQKSKTANIHLPFWDKLNRSWVKNSAGVCQKVICTGSGSFCGTMGGLGAVESQMIGFFVDGLYHGFPKMKVMCDNPNTFQGAVTTAVNEQNLCGRFHLHCTSSPTIWEEEPMEIGHVRPKKCYKCHKLGHIAKHCSSSCQSQSHVNTVSEQQCRGDHRPWDKNYNNTVVF